MLFDLTPPVVALLTPFEADGKIDWHAFKSYLTALSSWGVRSVISNGTTGEFPSLTLGERQKAVEFVRHNFDGSLINNVSSTCVDDAKKLIDDTPAYCDAVMILPPYYYAGVRNDGLCRFYEEALSRNSLPTFLYNFPQHTGNRLDTELIEMLHDKGIQVTGIKDSSGDLQNALAYQSRFTELQIFFASDSDALAALQNGLAGSVTGAANPLPEFLIAIQNCFGEANDKALTLQRSFDAWNDYRRTKPLFEIPLVKAAMGARIPDFPIHVRAPFTTASAEEISQIRTMVIKCLSDLQVILEER